MIVVIGSLGCMGKRYCQILKEIRSDFLGYDKCDILEIPDDTRGVIIATPTHTHFSVYRKVRELFKGPILCEKPFTCHLEDCWPLIADRELFIVNNYFYASRYSDDIESETGTYYNYFNSGKDGLHLDCVQLYYLSNNSEADLSNDSSVWKCMINGKRISKEVIDYSYVDMIIDFTMNRLRNNYCSSKFLTAHRKAIIEHLKNRHNND